CCSTACSIDTSRSSANSKHQTTPETKDPVEQPDTEVGYSTTLSPQPLPHNETHHRDHSRSVDSGLGSTLELVPHLVGSNRRPTGQRGALLWVPQAFRLLNLATGA